MARIKVCFVSCLNDSISVVKLVAFVLRNEASLTERKVHARWIGGFFRSRMFHLAGLFLNEFIIKDSFINHDVMLVTMGIC